MPAPAKAYLAVFKLPPDDHDVPSYSSVIAEEVLLIYPPKLKPADCVPHPAKSYLPVFKFPPDDHDVPLYSSVIAEELITTSPKLKPAVCVPAPAK